MSPHGSETFRPSHPSVYHNDIHPGMSCERMTGSEDAAVLNMGKHMGNTREALTTLPIRQSNPSVKITRPKMAR